VLYIIFWSIDEKKTYLPSTYVRHIFYIHTRDLLQYVFKMFDINIRIDGNIAMMITSLSRRSATLL